MASYEEWIWIPDMDMTGYDYVNMGGLKQTRYYTSRI